MRDGLRRVTCFTSRWGQVGHVGGADHAEQPAQSAVRGGLLKKVKRDSSEGVGQRFPAVHLALRIRGHRTSPAPWRRREAPCRGRCGRIARQGPRSGSPEASRGPAAASHCRRPGTQGARRPIGHRGPVGRRGSKTRSIPISSALPTYRAGSSRGARSPQWPRSTILPVRTSAAASPRRGGCSGAGATSCSARRTPTGAEGPQPALVPALTDASTVSSLHEPS